MRWGVKSWTQNLVGRLPRSVGDKVYYQLQRRLGSLRTVDPTSRLRASAEIFHHVWEAGVDPRGKTFLEVGTGWRINVPLGLWILGAGAIITVDLNRYLRFDLIREDLAFLRKHRDILSSAMARLPVCEERVAQLLDSDIDSEGLDQFLAHLGIRYLAPQDAAFLPIADETVDCHYSCNTMEHIPAQAIVAILRESRRVVRPGGVILHGIDMTDHFSHSDKSIDPVHFLRFSEDEWKRHAGNRFMYMNRLRLDDYLRIFDVVGLGDVRVVDQDQDPRILAAMESGSIPMHATFQSKSAGTLAVTAAWIAAAPGPSNLSTESPPVLATVHTI